MWVRKSRKPVIKTSLLLRWELVHLCTDGVGLYPLYRFIPAPHAYSPVFGSKGASVLSSHPHAYSREQRERLNRIHARLIEARRELDALIGDAYLRPRASIVPVHFLDLASAVEKLRWAEKEWRELDQEVAATAEIGAQDDDGDDRLEDPDPELVQARRG